jgi:Ca2+-binding RTX toxin-like protein
VAGGGNDLNNVITGNAANNIINGGGGANTLIGGDGNDYYFVASSVDFIIEFASQGIDIAFSTARDYTLADNVEHLIVWGNGLNGTGNAGNNIIFGNALNNTLADGAGSDILVGGGGQDTYNLSVDNTTDTLYIGVGDSLVTGYDKANNFNLGTGLATPAGTDRLDLPTTLIASDTPAVGGAIAGSSITGASISNGIISFQGMGGVAIPATALTLSDALSYIQANITDRNTVAFVTGADTFVFQDAGDTDTLIDLVGVAATSVNTTGVGTGAVWII